MNSLGKWIEGAELPEAALNRILEFSHSFHTPQVMILEDPEDEPWYVSFAYSIDDLRVLIDIYEDGSTYWFVKNVGTGTIEDGLVFVDEYIPEKVLNYLGIEVLRISEKAWKEMQGILKNPPKPNEALRELMKEYYDE